jgi:hypothetical protein
VLVATPWGGLALVKLGGDRKGNTQGSLFA